MNPWLRSLSWAYELGLRADQRFRPRTRLPVPVISVGNIAVGGRGKTPFTIKIANGLRERGFEPVVLTRGYGRKTRGPVWLEPTQTPKSFSAEETGDEALEIFARAGCAVLVSANRVGQAQKFLRERRAVQSRVFILDDGFQHWSLQRDFDLVLIDPSDHSDRPLPEGRLREPTEALARASLVLELGRDFLKHTRLPRAPMWSEPLTVITTRAPDANYRAFFAEAYSNLDVIELRDHAPAEDLLAELERCPFTCVALGAKEAVKVLRGPPLKDFFESGQTLYTTPRGRTIDLRYAQLDLEIKDEPGLWNNILRRLQTVTGAPR